MGEGYHYRIGFASPFNGSNEPGEPEYYTTDPRIRDPDAKHVDKARKHRDRALRHEAAADSLEHGLR